MTEGQDKKKSFCFEFIEYYPFEGEEKKKRQEKNPNFMGTVHFYCESEGLDFRGVPVFKNKRKRFIVRMPYFTAFDKQEGKEVRYPHVSFLDVHKSEAFKKFLARVLPKKIEDWYEKRNKGQKKKKETQPQIKNAV